MLTSYPSNINKKGLASSSSSVPAPKNPNEYNIQNFRNKLAYSQGSVEKGAFNPHACAKCGRKNSGTCRECSTRFFECVQNGHFHVRMYKEQAP